ncbi:MAG: OmpA family protein [Proteobacteria bacterium]|nr:OmpA family protein [Pseudomonadota bacterium]
MRKIILGLSLTCMAQVALAEDYDDRWMITPSLNFTAVDGGKNMESDFGLGIAIGKFLNEKWSLDLEYDRANFTLNNQAGDVSQTGLGLMGRYHFNEGSSLKPFVAMGFGYIGHDGDGQASNIDSSDFMINLGVGIRKSINDRLGLISEVKYRLDNDDFNGSQNSYDDYMFSMGLNIALGASEPVEKTADLVTPSLIDSDGDGVSDANDNCPNSAAGAVVDQYGCEKIDGDDDNDGVKNSGDKCPNSRAGAIVDKDGCDVQIVIELQGVHFDFDKSTLKTESVAILDAAVRTLGEHGIILVEVAGHTDSRASDSYNQKLSESRARVVFDYLVAHGISADRMTWKGYGESSPIATNDTDEGRAKNRRTELIIKD